MRYKKKSKHIELIRKVKQVYCFTDQSLPLLDMPLQAACANINCNHFSFIFINYETRIFQAEDCMKKKAIHTSKYLIVFILPY